MAASDRPLRSQTWFNGIDNSGFEHRTHLKARGGPPELFDGRLVVGVANSASDLVPCNAHLTGPRRMGRAVACSRTLVIRWCFRLSRSAIR
jgi:dihydroxyacid dehydratase/phosphogluconate dehydratase